MLFPILILLDQATKYLIRFFGGFYICNPGISFGINLPEAAFWLLWTIFIGILLYSYLKITNLKLQNQISKEQTSSFKFRNWDLKHYLKIGPPWRRKLEIGKIYRNKEQLSLLGISFILNGAISNGLDRFFLGCVIDFIDLTIWPVFNLADVFITIGGILIIIATYKLKVK